MLQLVASSVGFFTQRDTLATPFTDGLAKMRPDMSEGLARTFFPKCGRACPAWIFNRISYESLVLHLGTLHFNGIE